MTLGLVRFRVYFTFTCSILQFLLVKAPFLLPRNISDTPFLLRDVVEFPAHLNTVLTFPDCSSQLSSNYAVLEATSLYIVCIFSLFLFP